MAADRLRSKKQRMKVIEMSNRVHIRSVETLSDDWYVLKKTAFDYLRRDGTWQIQSRETYDRGNGAVILLYNRMHGTVVLTRQFRFPAYVNGTLSGMLIEACAGLLDQEAPEAGIEWEAAEETRFQIVGAEKIFEAYMSPGSVTEKLFFFIAEYHRGSKISEGGADKGEGEDIEVLELPLKQAIAMIESGEIADSKTIMLLQYAKLHNLIDGVRKIGLLRLEL